MARRIYRIVSWVLVGAIAAVLLLLSLDSLIEVLFPTKAEEQPTSASEEA